MKKKKTKPQVDLPHVMDANDGEIDNDDDQDQIEETNEDFEDKYRDHHEITPA